MRPNAATAGLLLAFSALVFAMPTLLAFGQQAEGSQFQVNNETFDYQVRAGVAMADNGSFSLVWSSGPNVTEPVDVIKARQFAADGSPLSGEFQVNTYTHQRQDYVEVAGAKDGSFVAVWRSWGSPGTDSSNFSIQGRRFDANGLGLGDQFQVNSSTLGSQHQPAISVTPEGAFVVAWADDIVVRGQRFTATGTALGDELLISTVAPSQRKTAVEHTPEGGFIVVWESFASVGDDNDARSVQGKRFDIDGTPLGSQFQVNTEIGGVQGGPGLAVREDGSFLATWHSESTTGNDTSGFSIQAQFYDAGGLPLGGQFQVNTLIAASQFNPRVEVRSDGGFLITWQDGSSSVQAQRFDRQLNPVDGEFEVPTFTTGSQYFPRISSDGNGRFLVSWTSTESPGDDDSETSIQARRFDEALFRNGFETGDLTGWTQAKP